MQFAQNLNELLTRRGISAYQISKDTGISDSLIGYWRRGEKNPTLENLSKLSGYLKVSVDWLLTGEERAVDADPLSQEEKELLSAFRHLTEKDKWKFIGKIQQCAERFDDNCETAEEIALKERKAG
jgi:transcriptional regulator with XRE-family HTH domain